MREIKFRAWDKKKKVMMFNIGISNFGAGQLGIYCSRTNDSFDRWHEDIDLLQYTGLKDKNGKEIYEGDIISVSCAGGDMVFEIVWEKNNARFNRKDTPYLSGGVTYGETTEIIGNIYENKDLLI